MGLVQKGGVAESIKNYKPPGRFYRWITDGGFWAAFKKPSEFVGLGPMSLFFPIVSPFFVCPVIRYQKNDKTYLNECYTEVRRTPDEPKSATYGP